MIDEKSYYQASVKNEWDKKKITRRQFIDAIDQNKFGKKYGAIRSVNVHPPHKK